jgi:TatD DNase family protein
MNEYPLIDIGANLTSSRFAQDLADVVANAQTENIVHAIVTGTSLEESRAALELVKQYPEFLSCTAGVHPHVASRWNTDAESEVRELLTSTSAVAVGECGLDFNRDFSPRDQQEKCFAAQLEIAATLSKPVFLHERDAHGRFAAVLKNYRDHLSGAVVHCFTGTKKELFTYLDLDCHIGITGWVCDERRGDDLREAVRHLPLNRLMLETDAPYLTPRTIKPRPPKGRNEPKYLPYVLEALSELREESAETIAAQALKNTREFFGL